MKVVIEEWATDAFLTQEEVNTFCKPGTNNACVWLLFSGDHSWECCFNNKPLSLVKRFEEGKTNAKRNGCEQMAKLNPSNFGIGPYEMELKDL